VQQDLLHLLARERVEGAHRLVHQQHGRVVGERAGDADALLHPARQLVDGAVAEGLEADQRQLLVGEPVALDAADAAHAQAERDVVAHREPGHQRVLLEHHAAIRTGPDDRPAVEQDLAARRQQEAGDAVEQRRLAAARRAEGDQEVAVAHRQVHRRQRLQRAALDGVVDRQGADVEAGQATSPSPS
jgi:hypothetical protein